MKYYGIIETHYGFIGVIMSDNKLSRLILPVSDKSDLEAILQNINENEELVYNKLEQSVIEQISSYFAGSPIEFDLQVDYTDATNFDILVWETARKIPYGTTISYMDLAEMIGNPKACRAVGRALGRNPAPVVVPCHRILRADGTLGGFSAGLPWKKILLDLESKKTS